MRITRNPISRHIVLAFLLSILLFSLTGCTKQRADWYLKSARKRVEAARQHEAERFSAPELQNVEEQIRQAQGNLASGNFQGALMSAQQAAELSKQLLDDTRAKRANTLKSEADIHVRIARENQAQQLNQELFDDIQKTNESAAQALSKQRYERTINLGLRVARDVESLLQPLKEEAETNLRNAMNRREELLKEEAEVEAPTYVTDTDRRIEEMRALIREERQYRQANQVYRDIVALVDEGITRSRWSRSSKKISALETKLARAIQEEAEIYTAQFLDSVQQQYQDILRNFYPPVQDYVKVLHMADLLEPQVDELILQTRILSSTAKIDAVVAAIRTLDANKVREYLPGRLEVVEEYLTEARALFDVQDFDECKKICGVALDEKDRIVQSFDELCASEIRAASGKLDEASSVLSQMADIFLMQAPASDIPSEQSFEASKQALKAVLDSMVRDIRFLVGTANVQREDGQFSNAIDNSRLAVSKSNYVIRETFRTVAHNNILELANDITQVSLNGGTKFAEEQMAKAAELLAEARRMTSEQEARDLSPDSSQIDPAAYRPIVSKTSEAKAAIEVAVHRITQGVIDQIMAADEAIADAEINKAGVYALGDISTARQILQQSNELLQARNLFESSQRAEEAIRIATEANIRSLRLWAQESIQAAESELSRSEDAQADRYAAPRYQEALSQIQSAQALFDSAANRTDPVEIAAIYEKARNLALGGQQDSTAARMAPLTEAQQAVIRARTFSAWQEDYPTLAQAIIDARSALESMQQGDYDRARAYANQASDKANQATRTAQSNIYNRRIQEVSQGLQSAAAQGGSLFNPDAIQAAMTRLMALQAAGTTADFETIDAELDAFETDLYSMSLDTPEIFNRMKEDQRAIYHDLVERGARNFASDSISAGDRYLRFAEIDFERGHYQSAYDNIMAAGRTLASVSLEYEERQYVAQVRALLAEVINDQQKIQPILNIPMPMMRKALDRPQFERPANAMFMGADPVRFRQDMDMHYKRSLILEYPDSMEAQHSLLLESLDLTRQSSMTFERFLILNQYDKATADEIVAKAFAQMDESLKKRHALTRQFEVKGLQGDLADIQFFFGR